MILNAVADEEKRESCSLEVNRSVLGRARFKAGRNVHRLAHDLADVKGRN